MAHPLLWPKKRFFYPIGNTPAACFTQQLAPEDAADILLLGCGDPRSIMFTVHVDLGDKRALDFTCCDAEPAVLARNIILFTMVANSDPNDAMLDNVWNIFYHFYLDEVSLNCLLDQCRKLVDMSTTVQSWGSSKYGRVFRFCTDASLLQIRNMWIKYLETETLSQGEKEALSSSFSAGMKDVLRTQKGVSTAFRSAGPLWLNLESMGADHFDKFWTTGTTSKPASHINPTFAYSLSDRKFNVHYGTDPLLSFHLAVPLAPTKEPPRSPATRLEDLDKSIKIQFRAWCTSFRTRLLATAPQIVIRCFVGEALAFCQALYHCKLLNNTKTGVYATPWGGAKIDLCVEDYSPEAPKRAPLCFNTIDTSNLSDHLGLLNVLLATMPLLRDTWSSMLHTHTLLRSEGHVSLQKGLSDKTCADIPMFSLLFGLVPCRHLSEITSTSSTHEIMLSSAQSGQFHDSLSWKRLPKQEISSDEPLRCEALPLGEFFFAMYLKMFADENVMAASRNTSFDWMQKRSTIHYSRHNFVAFLDLAKSRVESDWPKAMDHFISRIERDKTLLVGSNNYQDLCCSLHLREVAFYLPTVSQGSSHVFQGWKEVPKVVCVVLVVPRQSLKCLEDMHPDEIKTPILQCEIKGTGFQNVFYSLRPIFGSVEVQVDSVSTESKVNLREDTDGWEGSSPLIVSFYAPAWIFTVSPSSTQVVLSFRPTPSSTMCLMPKLGLFLTVYSASAMDKRHVFVTRHRPDNLDKIQSLPVVSRTLKLKNPPSLALESLTVKFDTSHTQAHSLIKRIDLKNLTDRNSLAAGATVVTKQISDLAFLVTFDKYQKVLEFPFPVDGSRVKTRIARKSFYVEVEAPILADPLDRTKFSLDAFPIILNESFPKLSNIHYLRLDRLPTLDVASNHKLDWLGIHLRMAFSDSEMTAKAKSNQKERGTLVNLKESISAILIEFCLNRKGQPLAAGLSSSSQGGIHTLIFVSEVKLDLTSNTVVADACVLPLTHSIMPLITPGLRKITNLQQVVTLEDEVTAWKQLLPAFAERCRTWKHTVNCEYLSKGIPVSVEYEESPLCGCGQGENLGPFSQTSAWKDFAPFVTRIALAPLFSTSFVNNPLSSSKTSNSDTIGDERCKHCGNPGNPKLLSCGACKVAKYCSAPCQKADWKKHKASCTATK